MSWPHIDTREDYERYIRAFNRGTQGFEICCAVPEYRHKYRCTYSECGHSFEVETFANEPEPEIECSWCDATAELVELDEEGSYDGGFSWSPCGICGRELGGDRQHFALTNPGLSEIIYATACLDCVYFAEYGKLDDETMLQLESVEGERA